MADWVMSALVLACAVEGAVIVVLCVTMLSMRLEYRQGILDLTKHGLECLAEVVQAARSARLDGELNPPDIPTVSPVPPGDYP